MNKRRWLESLCNIIIISIVVIPLLWMICASFMMEEVTPFHWIPQYFSLEAYKEVLIASPRYLMYFWNSLWLTLPGVVGMMLVAPLAGYGFARFSFPGRNLLLDVYILLAVLPYQTVLVPHYTVVSELGLLGSPLGVWLPAIFSPFGVYLMYRFFQRVPEEYAESAYVDGANEILVFARIALPQVKAGLATLFVLTIADQWNMIEQPLVFLRDETKYPMSVLFNRMGSYGTGEMLVCALLISIPIILIFSMNRESLSEGMETMVYRKEKR